MVAKVIGKAVIVSWDWCKTVIQYRYVIALSGPGGSHPLDRETP